VDGSRFAGGRSLQSRSGYCTVACAIIVLQWMPQGGGFRVKDWLVDCGIRDGVGSVWAGFERHRGGPVTAFGATSLTPAQPPSPSLKVPSTLSICSSADRKSSAISAASTCGSGSRDESPATRPEARRYSPTSRALGWTHPPTMNKLLALEKEMTVLSQARLTLVV